MDYALGPDERHIFHCESFSTLKLPEPETNAPMELLPESQPLEFGTPELMAMRSEAEKLSKFDSSSSDTFPEGGRQAWATVFASFCVVFVTQGATYSFGVFQDFYTRIYLSENSASKISWIGSTQLFLVFFLGLPTGKLFDEGYLRPLMITGSTIYIISFFMLSLAKPHQFYQVFLAQGLSLGLGMGLIYVPSISICLQYFKRRRALAVGIALLGGPIGAIVQTIGLNHLLNGQVGFAWGVRIFGFISFVFIIVGNVFMRPRLPPKRLRKDNVPKPNVKKVVADVPLLITTLAACLVLFAVYFPFFYLQLFAIFHGIPTNLAFYSISILNGTAIIGRIGVSILADKYGPVNTAIVSTVLLGIISFTMIKATTSLGLVLFAIFYGMTSGACISLGPPAVAAYVDNISDLGFAFGYASFIQSFFTLISGPVSGQILHVPEYRWNTTITVASLIIFVATAFIVISRVLLFKSGRKKAWRV